MILSNPTIKLAKATHKQPNRAVSCHLFLAMMLQMRSIWQMITNKHASITRICHTIPQCHSSVHVSQRRTTSLHIKISRIIHD
jgi:hypothetical protein